MILVSMIKKHILAISCAALWFLCPAVLLPFFPGVIFVKCLSLPRVRDDFMIWWGCVNITSFAFWVVVSWLSIIPGVHMSSLFHSVIAASIAFMLLRPVRLCIPDKTSIFQLVAILALFGIPFVTRIAFGSGDMTMHMYMASIIKHFNAIPHTYEPLLAIPEFGQYPIGFHLVLAYVSMLSGMQVYRTALLLFCYIFHLMFLSLYSQFGDPSRKWPVFIAVFLFIFFSHYPQFMFQWGSATTALSLTFLILLFPIMKNIGQASLGEISIAALIGAAALMCQPIPVFGFLLYFPVYYVVMSGIPNRKTFFNMAVFIIVAGIFSIGVFLRLPPLPNVDTLAIAQVWNLSQFRAVHPFIEKLTGIKELSPIDIPVVYMFILGVFTSVISFLAVFFIKDSKVRILYLSFLLVSFTVLLSKLYSFLPFNYALYPERVLVFMGIPIVLLYGRILSTLKEKQLKAILTTALVFFFAAFISVSGYPYKSYYRLLKEKMITPVRFVVLSFIGGDYITYLADNIHSEVTREDLVAINWIKDHVPRSEVIDCDYGSGGHLIPIIAGNKIFKPHYSFEFYRRHIESWQREQKPRYYFSGSGTLLTKRDMSDIPGKEVFRNGDAAVYYDAGMVTDNSSDIEMISIE